MGDEPPAEPPPELVPPVPPGPVLPPPVLPADELDVPPAEEPEPLGCAVESLLPPLLPPPLLPLGEAALGAALEPEGLEPEALEPEALEPPEAVPPAEPGFEASLEPDPLVAELDAPGEDGLDEAPPVPPAEGELLLGEDALLELEAPGLEALFDVSPPRSHAARPKASATAVASMESFMCPPRLGYSQTCKLRARPNPLIVQRVGRACRTPCRQRSTSYLLPPGLDGLVGLDWRFCAPDVPPEVPPAPDEPALPEAPEVPDAELPPDADRLSSPHPAIIAPLRANTAAAANAVNFMLTSMGLCPRTGARNGPRSGLHQSRFVYRSRRTRAIQGRACAP